MNLTYAIAMAAAHDAGNRSMRAAGRTVWDWDDAKAASDEFDRLESAIVDWYSPRSAHPANRTEA